MAPRKKANRPAQETKFSTATMEPTKTAVKRKANAQAATKRTAETLKGRLPGKAAQATAERVQRQTGRPVKAVRGSTAVATNAVVTVNPSIPTARRLREQLEPLGWTAHARAYFEEDDTSIINTSIRRGMVEFNATRDSELITVLIDNGKVVDQRYSIWDADRPATNGMPRVRLPFDPEELSDIELIRELSGQKVTWWNRTGQTKEAAVIGATSEDYPNRKITIQHVITMTDGEPDELPGSRIVTFVDSTPNGAQFRSFAVGSLMKIG